MEKAFKNVTNSIICSSIVAVIIGIIIIAYPDLSIATCGIIACLFIIAHGLLLIALDFQASKFLITFDGILSGIACIILGILDFICGVIMICNPFESAISLTLFVGIMIIVHSTVTIVDT